MASSRKSLVKKARKNKALRENFTAIVTVTFTMSNERQFRDVKAMVKKAKEQGLIFDHKYSPQSGSRAI